MFRLMLDCHAKISNPGEFDFLFDAMKADKSDAAGWRCDLAALQKNGNFNRQGLSFTVGQGGRDQLTGFLTQLDARSDGILTINVHRNIGKILALYPKCKVIHLLRDPRDVARSSIGMGWAGTLYHGVGHWVQSETDWNAVADQLPPEQVHQVKFEHLLEDIDRTLQQVCDFVGVEFDPAMLEYHVNSTYSAPDSALVEQWKHKSDTYEVAQVEYRAGKLMEKYGYLPAGPSPSLSGWQKLALSIRNKLYVWRFSVRRFGFRLFLWEKITRWLKLSRAHQNAQHRMHQIGRSHIQ